ncbi:MAG: ParA family protein [Candidatus Sedimenticola sp. PURPLELP]
MHNIMVLNAKGGCGKTTIATTLACYFSGQGYKTALMDFDPQRSSSRWLEIRSPERTDIRSIDATKPTTGMTRTWQLYSGQGTDVVIIDTPAGTNGGDIADHFNRADTIIIPVMASIIDLHAVEGFLESLLRVSRHRLQGKRIGLVANRVRNRNTKIYRDIEALSEKTGIPLIATLRDTQNYPIAMESGIGICELNMTASTRKDRKQLQPLISWLGEDLPALENSLAAGDSETQTQWQQPVAVNAS